MDLKKDLLEGMELVVGLEIHVQLNTVSKIFAAESAAVDSAPNRQVSPVSLALPGALPFQNKGVIEKAVRMGLALNCHINQLNTFDRKHYFYADLPKGYQITQDSKPICTQGYMDLHVANRQKTVRINRIHLEEDAGKTLHDQHEQSSLVDLNRAGVPLIEIVTEPDIRSADEAGQLFLEIRRLVRHLDVGDGNMEAGSLRCDANISVRHVGDVNFGTRCEVKNLNSIRNLRRAIQYEFQRQVLALNNGETIVQSTLNFDAESGSTSPMRSKEEANDYRYFPDPDLPPVFISDAWMKEIRENMPELPAALTARIVAEAGVTAEEASLIIEDPETLKFYNAVIARGASPRNVVLWLNGPIRAYLAEMKISWAAWTVSPEQIAEIIKLVSDRLLTQSVVTQQLLPKITDPSQNMVTLAKDLDLMINNNASDIDILIQAVLTEYAEQVAAYKKGKKGVLGLFVGEVVKRSGRKADPVVVNKMIIEKLKI